MTHPPFDPAAWDAESAAIHHRVLILNATSRRHPVEDRATWFVRHVAEYPDCRECATVTRVTFDSAKAITMARLAGAVAAERCKNDQRANPRDHKRPRRVAA